ncbi:MAG: hypothetical protein HY579_10745 [Nitrospinae bacterium]|nr:hypothetical protein [Nitrospinota bacterium]
MKRIRILLLISALSALLVVAGVYFAVNYGSRWIPEPLVQLAREPDLLENAESKKCSECHKLIFEAWKKSRHSRAWVSETYIKNSEDRSKEKCLACHIPEMVRAGVKPDPRLWNRDEGIYCVPCHVFGDAPPGTPPGATPPPACAEVENSPPCKGGRGDSLPVVTPASGTLAMNGPYDLFSPPHPTRQNPDYRKSKFCGSCHQKTLKEWEGTGSEKTCQSCHMPPAEARLTQKFILGLFHAKKPVGDHGFRHGEIGDADLAMEARIAGGAIAVALTNQTIPHLVPTADNGDPRLFLYAVLRDAAGVELEKYKEIIAPQLETALPYRKTAEYKFPLVPSAKRAEIFLQYQPAWSKERSDVRRIQMDL